MRVKIKPGFCKHVNGKDKQCPVKHSDYPSQMPAFYTVVVQKNSRKYNKSEFLYDIKFSSFMVFGIQQPEQHPNKISNKNPSEGPGFKIMAEF